MGSEMCIRDRRCINFWEKMLCCAWQGSHHATARDTFSGKMKMLFNRNHVVSGYWYVDIIRLSSRYSSLSVLCRVLCTMRQHTHKQTCRRNTPYTLHTVQGCLKHRFRSGIYQSASICPLAHPAKPAFLVSPASRYVSITTTLSDLSLIHI